MKDDDLFAGNELIDGKENGGGEGISVWTKTSLTTYLVCCHCPAYVIVGLEKGGSLVFKF